jgi:alpha-glucoside transport system ATP-binding protein
MTSLTITNLAKSYGSVQVLHDIDLEINSGEFVVFVGPSGCGKSTLLRCIAGLETISRGTVAIDGQVVNDLTPAEREIAMVFQSYALYPHMTVYDNMAFGLKMARTPKAQIDQKVKCAAEMLQLTQLLDRLPKQLSGGQRQRAAIGRAITRDPKLFLFDEPLSNLDAALRVATRIEIAGLKSRLPGATMIYVTHDQVEAMTLATRIVVLQAGRIEQIGTPLELYHTPANRFVAGFIGSPAMNFVGPVPDAGLRTATGDVILAAMLGAVTLGVRPEDLMLHVKGPVLLRGKVAMVENLGELIIGYVDIGASDPLIVKLPGSSLVRPGDDIALSADPARLHVFDAAGLTINNKPHVNGGP